jgi:hypothetical protein
MFPLKKTVSFESEKTGAIDGAKYEYCSVITMAPKDMLGKFSNGTQSAGLHMMYRAVANTYLLKVGRTNSRPELVTAVAHPASRSGASLAFRA